MFFIYKQPNGKIQGPENGIIDKLNKESRLKWKMEQFVSKHFLEGPIAGNFYQVWPKNVIELSNKFDKNCF